LKNNHRTDKDYLPINRWPKDERPREKLIKHGSGALSNSELLAIMLRTGTNNNRSSRSALDHIIVAESGYFSFKQKKLL
jgi:DNA repair protein RadC